MAQIFFIVLPILTAFAFVHASNTDLLMYEKHPFTVQYAAADSTAAKNIPTLMADKINDIHRDLKITASPGYGILIAPSRDYYQTYLKNGLPEWTGAFAVPAYNILVVKSPRWDRPETRFKQTLTHELVHLILHQYVRQQPIPRWLDEGLALFYEEPVDWDFPRPLSRALYTQSLIPLNQIDEVLSFQKSKADLAYQESYSAVTYLLSHYDLDGLLLMLDGLRTKKNLDLVMRQATGSDAAQFENEWRSQIALKYRYSWWNDFDGIVWAFIILLALFAGLWIRHRNKSRLADWTQEAELIIDPATEETPPLPTRDETLLEKDEQDA